MCIIEILHYVLPRNKYLCVFFLITSLLMSAIPNISTGLLQKLQNNLEFKLDAILASFNYLDSSLSIKMKSAKE